ncbi:transposase [Kurthia sibirica]
MIKTMKNGQSEMLNSFIFSYSKGLLEGINNKINMYGYL